jgi:hypothetical protein
MKYLTLCTVAALSLAFSSKSSAQIITGYETAVGPDSGTVTTFNTSGFTTTETISTATGGAVTSVTDPFAIQTYFTGSLGDRTTGTVTGDVTETIYLKNSVTSDMVLVDTLTSGELSSSSLSKPDYFGGGDDLNLTEIGTFDEVVYDVSGIDSLGGLLDFQGGFDFDVVPEPSSIALMLCGLGALALVAKRRGKLTA